MKKIRLLALMFLLILQSFLSPLAVSVSADDGQSSTGEQQEATNSGTESQAPNSSYTGGVTEEQPGETDSGMESQAPDSSDADGVTDEQSEEANTGSESATPDSSNSDQVTLVQPLAQALALVQPQEISSVEMFFEKLVVGESGSEMTIKDSEDAKNVELKTEQSAKVFYRFVVDAEEPYLQGSTFTFQLPQSILVFDQTALSGTVPAKDGEPSFKYETDQNRLVTVTFLDDVESGEYTITLNFVAKFGNFGNNNELEQNSEIPIKGK